MDALAHLAPAGWRGGVAAIAAAAVLAAALLLGLIGPVGALGADPLVQPVTNAPLHGCIAAQRQGDDPARLLAQPGRFDCRKPDHDWGAGSYWIRYALPAGSSVAAARYDAAPRQFSFVPYWQRNLAVITRDADGRLVSRWYDDANLSRSIGVGGTIAIPLEDGLRPVTDVLIRIDGALNASGLIGDPQLLDPSSLRRQELIAVAVVAAFGGLGFGLFCYNIVLWLTIRERFQLTYCLSLLAMLAYVWSNSAIMAQQFPQIGHTDRIATSYVMLGFVAALAMQFIADFIEPDKLPSRLRQLARNIGLACVIAGVGVGLAPAEWRHLIDRLYVISFVPLPLLVITLTTVAWRRGSRSVRILAVAWAIPVLSATVRIAHAFNVVPDGLIVKYSLVVAMSAEALLSSLAMSYRIKLITEDRDRARADERAARQLANIDALTGLLNRRALLEQLVAWSSPEPVRLLLVDIDRFKSINDRFGHLVGDEVLRDVAEVLAIRADLNASVARIGGEEFALVGTAANLSEAVALGILADFRNQAMAGFVNLTVSVGIAEGMVCCEDDWRELYRRADAALYRAKSEGRNRAVHAGSVEPLMQHAALA